MPVHWWHGNVNLAGGRSYPFKQPWRLNDPGLGSVHFHSGQEKSSSCTTFTINVAGPHRVSELAALCLRSPGQHWQDSGEDRIEKRRSEEFEPSHSTVR